MTRIFAGVPGAVIALIGGLLASLATAFLLSAAGVFHGATPACDLTQPVYAGTVQVGTWHAVLQAGQRLTLPDGDTAACTARGQLDIG